MISENDTVDLSNSYSKSHTYDRFSFPLNVIAEVLRRYIQFEPFSQCPCWNSKYRRCKHSIQFWLHRGISQPFNFWTISNYLYLTSVRVITQHWPQMKRNFSWSLSKLAELSVSTTLTNKKETSASSLFLKRGIKAKNSQFKVLENFMLGLEKNAKYSVQFFQQSIEGYFFRAKKCARFINLLNCKMFVVEN